MSYITDPVHPHSAFMGHLHIGRREDAECYGLYNLQVTQEWVRGSVICAVLNESKQLHAQSQPRLLLLYQWVLLCGLHGTLPLAWLHPKWMVYIMQVAGCCGEEIKSWLSIGCLHKPGLSTLVEFLQNNCFNHFFTCCLKVWPASTSHSQYILY